MTIKLYMGTSKETRKAPNTSKRLPIHQIPDVKRSASNFINWHYFTDIEKVSVNDANCDRNLNQLKFYKKRPNA